MDIVKSFKHAGLYVRIVRDEDPTDPRTWDNLGHFVCFHRRYNLGDKHSFHSPREVEVYIKKTKAVAIPVYMYDHSGLAFSVKPFSCPWDSGQIGVIFVTREKILKDYGKKRMTKDLAKMVEAQLAVEIETYNQYHQGDVYGFLIDSDEGTEDSCYGHYGLDYCETEAKMAALVCAGNMKKAKELCLT